MDIFYVTANTDKRALAAGKDLYVFEGLLAHVESDAVVTVKVQLGSAIEPAEEDLSRRDFHDWLLKCESTGCQFEATRTRGTGSPGDATALHEADANRLFAWIEKVLPSAPVAGAS